MKRRTMESSINNTGEGLDKGGLLENREPPERKEPDLDYPFAKNLSKETMVKFRSKVN